jgi:hypothetical protein
LVKRKILWPVVLLGAFAALIPVSSEAGRRPPKARKNPPAAAKAKATVSEPSMRAFIDPRTGELREPTPEEARALSEAVRKTAAPEPVDFEPVQHPDGMVSVDLKGAFMSHVIAQRNRDGSFSTRCIPASHAGSDAPMPAPPPPIEEK